MLPVDLTSGELLQIRWIMTYASYLAESSLILLHCNNPIMNDLIEKALLFLSNNLHVSQSFDSPAAQYDMILLLNNESIISAQQIHDQLKPNGYLVFTDDAHYAPTLSYLEIGDLKIYRKPVEADDIDIGIHIFIPVHNRIDQTLRCLHSINKQTIFKQLNVTIIDDGSTDDTVVVLKEKFPDVSIITGNGSLWWTGAISKALELNKTSFKKDDYFLLINNDVILSPNTILSLIVEAVKDRSLCLAPIGFNQDESIACGEAENGHIFYRFEQSGKVMAQNNNIYPVMSLFGRCSLFPVEILDDVHNFDAGTFPHYWGDTDFCLRAAEFGYKFQINGHTSVAVQHDIENTGSHHDFFTKKRTLKEIYNYLTDIKSLGNIKYIWRFYSRHYPQQKYRILLITLIKALKQAGYKA